MPHNVENVKAVPADRQAPIEDRDDGLPEPAWYLSSWELRCGLTVIEHDDSTTVPGDLGD
jgi:hypothetical protein